MQLQTKVTSQDRSIDGKAYNTGCQRKRPDSERDGNEEDAEDGRAAPAVGAGAVVVALAEHVVEAGEDRPRDAAEQQLALLQLAADVHVGKQEALPVAILLLRDVVLKCFDEALGTRA